MIKLKDLLSEANPKEEVMIDSDRKFVLGHLDKIQKELDKVKRGLKKSSTSGRDVREFANMLGQITVRAKAMSGHISDALGDWYQRKTGQRDSSIRLFQSKVK